MTADQRDRAPVVIVTYDERWPALFEAARAELEAAVGPLVEHIEHAGSTSVPGLAAKPIIDIAVGVADFEAAHATVAPLVALGWDYRGEYGIPRRHYYARPAPPASGCEGYHLHMNETGGEEYGRTLLFRDYLRAHPEAAGDYAALKRVLAARFGTDRERYTDAKSAFVRRIEALAAR